MDKTRKTLLIFLMIVIQSIIAMATGIAVLFNASIREIPENVYVGEVHIGTMGYGEAAKAIDAEYGAKFRQHTLQLRTSATDISEISFSNIDAYVDSEATLAAIKTVKSIGDIPRLINMHFGHHRTVITPVVKFSESKLRMELAELSKEINTSPTDARVYYKDGIIEKEADNPGLMLDVNATVKLLENTMSSNPFVVVNLNDAGALKTIVADVTIKDYDDIQQVLGEYSTSIKDSSISESIQYAVEKIDGTMLAPAGENEFSFAESLELGDGEEYENDGYDQVASTLYAALLTAGMPKETIIRLRHKITVDYIEPGLDAWISGNAGDVKFSNTYENKLVVFAVKNGSVVTVAIGGSREDKAEKSVIRTETIQEFEPPVYYVEKEDLKPGEKIVLNPGKKGISVKVFRNNEFISTDQYEAETSIIQIAPTTETIQNDNK